MNKVEQRIHGDEGDLLVEATHLIGHLMDLCKVRDDYHGNGIIDAAYTFLVQRELQGDLSGVCDCEGNASDVARAEAWQKALGHLKQDALDVTAIS